MTVICAMKDPKRERVIITSDTGGKMDGIWLHCGPKWIVHDGWGFGISGEWRASNIAEAHAKDLLEGLKGPWDFVEAWRKLLGDHNFDLKPSIEGCASPNGNQHCILANHETIWCVAADFSWTAVPGDFFAEGSGQQFALGAALALDGLALEPDEVINRATNAAIDGSAYCHGPIWIGQVK